MLHINNPAVQKHLLSGNFGLEKENLRILCSGTFSHTQNPFQGETHIVRDFSENQVEINTSVRTSIHDAVIELHDYETQVQGKLKNLSQRECLWHFSNPPYILDENDIPVARFEGEDSSKTQYREYLADKYGRYKMAFSGIHFNFSFSEELLKADFALTQETDFTAYKNKLYLNLAEQLAANAWILVAATAASPLLDSSFLEQGVLDRDVFIGMASVRCSEFGYWNEFVPVFDYTDLNAYADSIQRYVDQGLLKAPSELYYPVRLKPRGENTLSALRANGVDHIELRMFDLNPLSPYGIEEKDILFAQLLMLWLLSKTKRQMTERNQIQAVQNLKNAARYDLRTVKITMPDGKSCPLLEAAENMISEMKNFYETIEIDVREVLEFEQRKFLH